MTSSISGAGSTDLVAAMLQQQATTQNIDVAVLQKGLNLEKMQGEAVLKLIDTSANPAQSGGIDVRV